MRKLKIENGTIARTIILTLALINQLLAISGKEIIPITDESLYQLCSVIATIVVSVWTWWKNNSFTTSAIEADGFLRVAKIREGIDRKDEGNDGSGTNN